MKTILLLLLASCLHAQSTYLSRFLGHSTIGINNGIQYRQSSATIDLNQYFGSARVDQSDIQAIEKSTGIDIPLGAENILMEIKIPATGTVSQKTQGIELIKSITVGIPYLQTSLAWSGRGRLEDPAIQQGKIFSLLGDLVKSRQLFLQQLAIEGIKAKAAQQSIIRGRIDLQIELNVANIINYKLREQKQKRWKLSANIFPYWISSLDASNRIGIIEAIDTKEVIKSEVEKLHIPFASDITEIATDIIDNKLFVPTNPFYNGFGAKGLIQIKYKKAFQLGWFIDYSNINNGQNGIKSIKSLSSNINLKIGL